MRNDEVFFRERQRFTQPWIWLLVGGPTVMVWYGAYVQLVLGRPWGSNPASDALLRILVVVFGIGMPLLFAYARLDTAVTATGIRVRFLPFHLRHREWRWHEIERIERRTYSPLGEYGGWGIRTGGGGWAYNVRGTEGVQLVLRSGSRILIGSQDAGRFILGVQYAQAKRSD